MADGKGNAKMTGDTHLPDVESDLPLQEGETGELGADGTPSGRARADEGHPGRGINQAGLLKDKDGDTQNTAGNAPDSGAGSQPKSR
jgi:hypothetical protein